MRTCPVSVSTSISTPLPATIQNGVALVVEPIGVRRDVVRLVDAGTDDIARLHAVFLPEQIGERSVATFRLAQLAPQRRDLGARFFGREPHRVTHVKQRARAERAHIVGRHVGIARHDPYRLGRHVEHFADHLRHRGIGALPHVNGAAIQRGAAVGRRH